METQDDEYTWPLPLPGQTARIALRVVSPWNRAVLVACAVSVVIVGFFLYDGLTRPSLRDWSFWTIMAGLATLLAASCLVLVRAAVAVRLATKRHDWYVVLDDKTFIVPNPESYEVFTMPLESIKNVDFKLKYGGLAAVIESGVHRVLLAEKLLPKQWQMGDLIFRLNLRRSLLQNRILSRVQLAGFEALLLSKDKTKVAVVVENCDEPRVLAMLTTDVEYLNLLSERQFAKDHVVVVSPESYGPWRRRIGPGVVASLGEPRIS